MQSSVLSCTVLHRSLQQTCTVPSGSRLHNHALRQFNNVYRTCSSRNPTLPNPELYMRSAAESFAYLPVQYDIVPPRMVR